MNTPTSQKSAARDFVTFWTGKGYEKGQTQPFWIGLLRVLGVENPDQGYIEFEDRAHIDAAHGFIDGYIPATHVLIEQKSLDKNLRAGISQSDGSILTPFQQAKRYAVDLPYSRRPRFIVVSNFAEFDIYDMENPNGEPERLLLKDLPREFYRLKFLTDTGSENIRREEEISKRAGDVVGLIYDALLKQYRDPTNPQSLKSLNELCVRLVFLLYAEDADVFTHLQFHDYLVRCEARDARRALIELFKVLDTPTEDRDPYLEADLAAFPYVNGGLFANENIEIPQFTDEILDLILRKGSEDFDWKGISPTIFGAVFESTLNPETRRSGGMHYTSVENIHKVIDPLFLDALKDQLADIKRETTKKKQIATLHAFTDKIASLTFLDPACGSGNFLTETYISLRRLENEALKIRFGNETQLDLGDLVKVSIGQFHGIEINDFACSVAKTALWIAENQMLRETEAIAHHNLEFLPLKNYDGIVEGNALRIDWMSLASRFDYIVGNPPFSGGKKMGAEQKKDMLHVFGKKWKNRGNMDYVSCWYKLALDYMKAQPATRTALVSTNSVTQGQSVPSLFGPLLKRGLSIDFAHRSFRWDSESNSKAHVHCVIIGFSCGEGRDSTKKRLFDGDNMSLVEHINPYLLPIPDILVDTRTQPICDVPTMDSGNMPNDGKGKLLLSPEERETVLRKEPDLAAVIRPFVGVDEFIIRKCRYCFWLVDASPAFLRASPTLRARVEAVREARLASPAPPTREKANIPHLFFYISQPDTTYLLVPGTSSENRRYIPIDFMDANTIASNANLIIPKATLYHFGVLTSNVHMAWMRAVAGRHEMRYRYSNKVVYNNFPWPEPTEEQKARIEETAHDVLAARDAHPNCTFADLYDDSFMPPDLRKAHQENDRAVMAAYGFSVKMTESECVAELFMRYRALVSEKRR